MCRTCFAKHPTLSKFITTFYLWRFYVPIRDYKIIAILTRTIIAIKNQWQDQSCALDNHSDHYSDHIFRRHWNYWVEDG